MSRKILIDGLYNEIRVVLCNDNEVSEFSYQNNVRSLTKGNVYLGKIERIEASLQAAFVNYGAGKHGFLPFAEIHPLNYQISTKEKEGLLGMISGLRRDMADGRIEIDDESDGIKFGSNMHKLEHLIYNEIYKKYKIQDILKKEQNILIQIAKEERGSKGATLTTYISLLGRYSVFMPHSNKLGGVSRSINNLNEESRLAKLVEDLREKEQDSAIVIRGNAIFKTKTEIRRDFNNLIHIWESIQENSKKSKAPSFIYEEGDVIKKVIRDTYDSEIEEIIVSGEKAYQDTLAFMQLVLPRHVDKIKEYSDTEPLFAKYGVEQQINQLYVNKVPLKSGGYIVIDQAEALVAIDVNSGKSIGESNVEDTALRTNLEAAGEVTKQLRLRDLSGLIVIDFIDMQSAENRVSVEGIMKLALSDDPAHTQLTKLSEFGVMEMTRQRLQNTIYEANFTTCHACGGRGKMRAIPVTASTILRAIQVEIELGGLFIEVSGAAELILYILNTKRSELHDIEKKHGVIVRLLIDEKAGYDGFFIEHKDDPDGKASEALSTIDDYFPTILPHERVDNVKPQDGDGHRRGHRNNESRGSVSRSSGDRDRGERSQSRNRKFQGSTQSQNQKSGSFQKDNQRDGSHRREGQVDATPQGSAQDRAQGSSQNVSQNDHRRGDRQKYDSSHRYTHQRIDKGPKKDTHGKNVEVDGDAANTIVAADPKGGRDANRSHRERNNELVVSRGEKALQAEQEAGSDGKETKKQKSVLKSFWQKLID